MLLHVSYPEQGPSAGQTQTLQVPGHFPYPEDLNIGLGGEDVFLVSGYHYLTSTVP